MVPGGEGHPRNQLFTQQPFLFFLRILEKLSIYMQYKNGEMTAPCLLFTIHRKQEPYKYIVGIPLSISFQNGRTMLH